MILFSFGISPQIAHFSVVLFIKHVGAECPQQGMPEAQLSLQWKAGITCKDRT